jgi:hypothetical protein
MSDTEEEHAWRAEFEAAGERQVHDTMYYGPGYYPDPQRLFALRWLREKEVDRANKDREMLRYVQWTLWAAVAAVIVGIIAILK